MQSHQPPKPTHHAHAKARRPGHAHSAPPAPGHKPPAQGRLAALLRNRRTRLALIAGGALLGVAVLALLAVNLLISADWVRDRVAARIKEQTGRELKVNGTTALLFAPGPKVVISDAVITDPEARAGTSDLSLARLELDLGFGGLLSRKVDAKRVVLVRPLLTVRLGETPPKAKEPKPENAKARDPDKPRRDVRLEDIRIEDGTVDIVYDEKGTDRRIEHIAGNFSLPSLSAPLTGSGKFEWKDQAVNFSFSLASLAGLRQKQPAKLEIGLDTPAIAARFDGNVVTRPGFAAEGELSAKAHSIPSLLAWMRAKSTASSALGDGELASHVTWKEGEIAFTAARFALEHASGQGQAVVTLKAPRPHVRAALALDHLDLNPFLAASGKPAGVQRNKARAPANTAQEGESGAPQTAPSAQSPGDLFSKPDTQGESSAMQPPAASPEETSSPAPGSADMQQSAPPSARDAEPASFDADINLNVRKTRYAHLEFGPASLGLAFRDGVLNATLGGMELYQGHAAGKLVIDASKQVPEFNGDFRLEGVQAKALLSDAAQFSLLEGETKLALKINGSGADMEQVKSSLQGEGSIAVSDGAIEGINLTEMISQLGEGQIPEMRQGPGAKTAFGDLGGSFTIRNGVAETNNLQMTSPLLKVTANGSVDLTQSSINMLAESEIVAGPEGKGGANDLAGLSLPVRIEGPLDRPTMRPELKAMFANPEKAGKTVNQIGKAIEKKFKGKPVGEAIGRILGNVQIGKGDNDDSSETAPKPNRQRSGKKEAPQAEPPAATEQDEPVDPDLENILR